MLTAMMVVDGLVAGNVDKASLWEVNTELDYHEEKGRPEPSGACATSPSESEA